MRSTIFFHPDAYIASGGKLMGRHAAGDSFLRGYLAHSRQDTISAFVTDPRHGETFKELLVNIGDKRPVEVVDKTSLGRLIDTVLYYPGPDIVGQAFNRSLVGNSALGCTQFQRHFVKVFNGTGGVRWCNAGSFPRSSNLSRSTWCWAEVYR